ncbi:MAG: hypothetical protein ACK4XG_05385 [Chromatiaceae bacterium]
MRCHPWRLPSGQRVALLKTAPGGFLCAAIHGAYLSGQRCALLKTAPGGFLCPGMDGTPTLQVRGTQSLSVIRTIHGTHLPANAVRC